jgi:uncharacterized protein
MSVADDADLVAKAYDAVNRRDFAALVELTTDDFVFYPAFSGGGLVEGAVYRGHAGIRRFLDEQSETWSEITFALGEVIPLGDVVVGAADIRAVGRGSGVEVRQHSWGVFRASEGKLTEGRIFTSEADARAAATPQED